MFYKLKKWKILNRICIIAEAAVILILLWDDIYWGSLFRMSSSKVILLLFLLMFLLTQLVLSFVIRDTEQELYNLNAKLIALERRLLEKENSGSRSSAEDNKDKANVPRYGK